MREYVDRYIPESKYQVVGKLESESNPAKLYHVGYRVRDRYKQPLVCIADSPDKIVLSKSVTIDDLLKFSPMGWVFDVEKINSLYL